MGVGGTTTRATTKSYEAPEVNGDKNLPRSRRYDMWSMGCILLEFVVWLMYGQDPLKSFETARIENYNPKIPDASFYVRRWQEEPPGYELNPAVEEAMKALTQDERCQGRTIIGDIVALIPMHLLQVDAEKRSDAEKWCAELNGLVSKAEDD